MRILSVIAVFQMTCARTQQRRKPVEVILSIPTDALTPMATPAGFEPATYRLGICRSILLSYGA